MGNGWPQIWTRICPFKFGQFERLQVGQPTAVAVLQGLKAEHVQQMMYSRVRHWLAALHP